MSIVGTLNELKDLEFEIKNLSARLKTLRGMVKQKNEVVQNYLREKDQPGLKYQGKAYLLGQTTKRIPKKKTEREADSLRVLQEAGVSNPEKILAELLEARKGNAQETEKLKIQKLKSKST